MGFIQTCIECEISELDPIDRYSDELRNLALLPEYRDLVKSHHVLLVSGLQHTKAHFVDTLPAMRSERSKLVSD